MKHSTLLVIVGVVLALVSRGTANDDDLVSISRQWKSTTGSSLEGKLFYFDEKRVVIKPEGQAPVVMKPEQLSPEDQDYLQQWRAEKMTQWSQDPDENADPRFSSSVVILPKFNRPVRMDSKGQLKEPFPVLFVVLEKNPNILKEAPKWWLTQTVEAHSEDGRTKMFASFNAPLAGNPGEVSLVPISVGVPLSQGKIFLYLQISGPGKGLGNQITVKVEVER